MRFRPPSSSWSAGRPGPHWYTFRLEGLPAITDADGKPIPIVSIALEGLDGAKREPKVVDLAAGKEIDFCELKLDLRPASESAKKGHRTLYGMGKFQIQYEQVTAEYMGPVMVRLTLSKLGTGKLELEVRDAQKLPEKKQAAVLLHRGGALGASGSFSHLIPFP
jgi:hypothetical protein